MEDQVLDRALLFLGTELNDCARLRLKKLCQMAVSQLILRLREGKTPEELGEQFIDAAGVLALSMYVALGGEDFSAVKIGSITIERDRSGRSFIDDLRHMSEQLLAGCLREQGFVFKGVRG